VENILQDSKGFDEVVYLKTANNYREHFLNQDLEAIINDPINTEHPQLAKFLFSGGILLFSDLLGLDNVLSARLISIMLASIVSIVLLIEFGMLSSLFWIFSSWSLTFTSQIYLDPALTLFSLLAIVYYQKFEIRLKEDLVLKSLIRDKHFWLTILFASAAFAAKYTGILVLGLIVIRFCFVLISMGKVKRYSIKKRIKSGFLMLSCWAIGFIGFFFVLNPRALNLSQFIESILYHQGYSTETYALKAEYHPPLGQLTYFIDPSFWGITQDVFPFIDGYLLLLSILALILFYAIIRRSTRSKNQFSAKDLQKYDLMALFFVLNILFLMIWPTKWPQYLLPMMIPIVIFSELFFKIIYKEIQSR
jgi:4-amino-4-deoxy-L-arabinose transferase-like glycosyltransferase